MNGTSELLILSCLDIKPCYPFEICTMIEENMDSDVSIPSETIYTNFEYMYRQGYVKRESTIIGDKKKRVYYSLLPKGKERLEILLREYNRVVKGVNLIIEK
jgi:DNA-binding PadR family transcriptional regulator